MNPLAIKGIAALVVAIALAGIGWKVNQWRHDAGQLKHAREELAAVKRQQAADAALASDYAKQIEASRAATERLRQRVAAIPKETLVYVETPGTCPKLSADFVREYNAVNTD